jgi:hypothetical protein
LTLQVIAYLVLAWATGVALTFVSRLSWHLEARLALGAPVGFGAAAMLTWLIAIPLGMSTTTAVLGAIALTAVLIACVMFTDVRARLTDEAGAAVARWKWGEPVPLWILLALALLFFMPFYGHALQYRPDGLYAGYVTIWGDWSTHLSLSGYLANTPNLLPPQNPFLAGTNLTYPFLPDLFSSVLINLGAAATQALTLVSFVLSLALVVIFYAVTERITGSRWAGFVAVLVMLAGSGLGFLRVLGDVQRTGGGVLGWLDGLFNLIGTPPHDHSYTQDGSLNFQWLNPILAYLVPQRTTLFGWSLGLFALALLWHAWRDQGALREMLIAGVLLGMMPLLHASTYFDMIVIAGGLMLLSVPRLARAVRREGSPWRPLLPWLALFVPALLLGLPQVKLILPAAAYSSGGGGSRIGPAFCATFHIGWFRCQPGWLSHDSGFIWFWFINTGLLIPLAAVTFAFARWGKPHLRSFLLPAWLLFLIPNLVVLQPWDWDNTKWFVWWAIPASMLVGLLLVRLVRAGPLLAVLAALLLVVQVASGALDLDRAAQSRLSAIRFLDRDELALADWARTTPRDSVFLTAWQHNHPVLTLSRRVEVMGWTGWLWSWGVDYTGRQRDVIAMFHGDADAPQLLRQYYVRFVVIGPAERGENPQIEWKNNRAANVIYFASRYPMAYQSPSGEYEVFRVS